jgi:hypothetical protein
MVETVGAGPPDAVDVGLRRLNRLKCIESRC